MLGSCCGAGRSRCAAMCIVTRPILPPLSPGCSIVVACRFTQPTRSPSFACGRNRVMKAISTTRALPPWHRALQQYRRTVAREHCGECCSERRQNDLRVLLRRACDLRPYSFGLVKEAAVEERRYSTPGCLITPLEGWHLRKIARPGSRKRSFDSATDGPLVVVRTVTAE